MKSKIKSISKNERRMEIYFKKDNQIVGLLEKAFQKLKPDFKLADYSKIYKNSPVADSWELNRKDKDFNFAIITKENYVRLILKGSSEFKKSFLKTLEKDTEFVELLPKIKAKNERRSLGY